MQPFQEVAELKANAITSGVEKMAPTNSGSKVACFAPGASMDIPPKTKSPIFEVLLISYSNCDNQFFHLRFMFLPTHVC